MKIKNFISFEGIDGAGKTTQINLLKEKLEHYGYKVCIYREPGGIEITEKIRKIILNKDFKISKESELLLFLAARAELVRNAIISDLKNNCFVICDRYIDSTLAYQGYGRKIDLRLIERLNNFVVNDMLPSCTFYLDIDINTMIERKIGMNKDRMEQSGLIFFKDVRDGYLTLVKKESRIIKIDANKQIKSIESNIWKHFQKIFKGYII